MPEKLSCANGHLWESNDVEALCPVCGSAAESFDDGESSTWDSGTSMSSRRRRARARSRS